MKNKHLFSKMLPSQKYNTILNLLLSNSKLSYRQIAKKINVSVATVMKHIQYLEKNNFIKKYTVNLDYYKLGYEFNIIIRIRVSKGKFSQMKEKISINNNVYAIYDIIGQFDAQIMARFKTRQTMDNFLKKIQSYDFIERTETSLILNTLKEENLRL